MTKKHLFKRATALLLSALLATSPALVYAEDAMFVDEVGAEEVAQDEVGFSDEITFDDGVVEDASESASFDVVGEESFEEEATGEDEGFAADFFDDVEVSYDDATMASDIVEDVVDDQVAAADVNYVVENVTVTFNANGGSGGPTTQTIESGVSTPLDLNEFTNATKDKEGFAGWSTTPTGSVAYRDGASVRFTAENTILYAIWDKPVATVGSLKYAYLKDAFAAVPRNETVILTADSSNSEAITVDRTCSFEAVGTATKAIKVSNAITVNAGSKLTINEGDFLEFTTVPRESSTDALQIKGGIYPSTVKDFCAEDYYVTSFKDGTTTKYKVIKDAVARIGDLYYKTLADAFEAVNAGSGTITLYIIDDISGETGKVANTVIKNNLVIATGKKNDAAVSIEMGSSASSGGSARIRFDGTFTVNKEVTINGLIAGIRGATSIYGSVGSTSGKGFHLLGNTLTVDKESTTKVSDLNVLYGSTVNIEGALSAGDAIGATGSAPLTVGRNFVIGNRGKNTVNLKNAAVTVTGNIAGSNDEENGGTISSDLSDNFNYKPTSIPANAVSEINLDNASLTGASLNFETAGIGKTVNLKNKSQLVATGTLTLNEKDTISMEYDSKISVGGWTNDGTLKVNVSSLKSSDVPPTGYVIVDDTTNKITTATMGTVTLEGNTAYGVSVYNGDIVITKAAVALTHNSKTTYTDLETALANAEDGDTIQLLADDKTATPSIEDKITLDLNGYNMSGTVSISKDVTITDTYASTVGSIAAVTVTSGKLTLEKGEIDTLNISNKDSSAVINGGEVGTIIAPDGSISISGGEIDSINLGSAATTTSKAKLTITGGKFTDKITVNTYFDSVTVPTTMTNVMAIVEAPAGYVWLDKSGTSSLVKFTKAVSDADAGSTIKLSSDKDIVIEDGDVVTVEKTLTIDLNGRTISGVGSSDEGTTNSYLIGVEKGGSLTIIDTASDGSIKAGERNIAIFMNPSNNRSTSPATLIVGSATATGNNDFSIGGHDGNPPDGYTYAAIGGEEGHTNTSVSIYGGDVSNINCPQKNSTIEISGGEVGGVDIPQNATGTGTIALTISGGIIHGLYEYNEKKLNNVTISVTGGQFDCETDDIHVENVTKFISGGKFVEDPSKNGDTSTNYIADGYTVKTTSGKYKYEVGKAVDTFVLTVTAPNLSTATLSPASGTKYEVGASVALSASAAPTGYTFGGWYAGTTQISSSLTATYTMPASASTVEARYLKNLTVKANDDTVATGSDYVGDKTKITVTGANSGDTNIVNTTNMTMTAATYNKSTSAIGSKHDIVLAGATINTTFSTKYTITTYTKGTLTVIEGTGPETFIADVAKLPAATAVTVDNLAATKAGVETAKSDYSKLSTTAKDLSDVKTAKAKLDAVEAAVTKLEADKAAADVVTTAIAALPAAADAKASDKKAADDAKDLYDALTADQKKLISDADVAKLNAVKAAADKAEETDAAAAKKVKDDAAKLPSITQVEVSDKAAVQTVRDEYKALTPEQQARIPEVDTQLKALEDVIAAKEEEEKKGDQEKADEVAALIEAIKDAPAGKQKAATEEAREAFDDLTDAQKALLPKSAETLLEDAETAFEEGRIFGLNGQRYKVLSNGDVTYHRPQDKETVTSVSVPNQVSKGGYLFKVVKISINAFNSCPNLEWVVVGKNVVSLGKCSFKGTPKLKKIKFMGTGVKTATSAFTGAGKNKGANLTILTKGSVVDKYETLFKGAGKLNANATVEEMA